MRRWALLGIVLILMAGLAACGSNDEQDDSPPVIEATPTAESLEPEGTQEPEDAIELVPREPGINAQSGLTVITHSVGAQDGIAYFFGAVRNDTGQTLRQIYATIYPLDEEQYPFDSVQADTLLTDIPAGQTVYLSSTYPAPEGYADAQIWLRYEAGEPMLQGYFNLPATVASSGSDPAAAYMVRGTVENSSGVALTFPVVDVALVGPDETLIGVAHAVITEGLEDGTWPAGGQVSFEAPFDFVQGDSDQVGDVRVLAAGYAPLP